jgi:hypothetical protein
VEHMGLSSSIYMMYLQNWTTGNSPTIACAWSNKANIPCVNSDLSLFPWKEKDCVSWRVSPPKTHTYTHYYLIAFCTQHNFLKWILKKTCYVSHLHTQSEKLNAKRKSLQLCWCSSLQDEEEEEEEELTHVSNTHSQQQ